jgi:hypothetical protein
MDTSPSHEIFTEDTRKLSIRADNKNVFHQRWINPLLHEIFTKDTRKLSIRGDNKKAFHQGWTNPPSHENLTQDTRKLSINENPNILPCCGAVVVHLQHLFSLSSSTQLWKVKREKTNKFKLKTKKN